MSTTIKSTCNVPGCYSDCDLTPEDIRLKVCGNAPALSAYHFVCPHCRAMVSKPATDEIVSLLVDGGVPPETWNLPAEALEEHAGPRLSYDDLLDFALHLGTTDLLAEVAGARVRS